MMSICTPEWYTLLILPLENHPMSRERYTKRILAYICKFDILQGIRLGEAMLNYFARLHLSLIIHTTSGKDYGT